MYKLANPISETIQESMRPYTPKSPCGRGVDPWYRDRVVSPKSQIRYPYVGIHRTNP